jgi:serine/threonine-protein kinase
MHDLPAPGTIVAGKYRVESLLGEGGMSTVFRAHHELMDKAVALKWLRPELAVRPEAKDRFMREARASARIKHPNVVDVHDVGVHEGALFLVMELMEGESFADLISHGNISIPHAIRLLLGAMEGVAMAHDVGIVHRDIKPENIFVVRNRVYPDGIAKILDFGISKLTEEGGAGRSLTKTGHTVGTPEYMSMEQMTGDPDVDGRADVYSFGVLLYRALTGSSPFSGETFAAIAVKVATTNPIPPRELRPDLPPALEQVVMKAMARNRDQRYPSIRALIDALTFLGSTQGFLSQMPHPASGAPLLTPTPNGLRDLLPFSNFRADTVQLRTPAQPTKALTEPSIAPRPVRMSRPEKSRTAPLLLALGLLGAVGVGVWQLWPHVDVARSAQGEGGKTAGQVPRPPSAEQERPLAQQPQAAGANNGANNGANSGVDDWNPSQPVHLQEVGGAAPEPVAAGAAGAASAPPSTLPPAVQPAVDEAAFRPIDAQAGRPIRRHDGHRKNSASVVSSEPVATTTKAPVAEPAASPTTTKSATGRRSGTLRSDDF